MILYLTNADTEILSIAMVHDELDPALAPIRALRLEQASLGDLLAAEMVVVRALGGIKSLGPELIQALESVAKRSISVAVFSGEADFDSELCEISNVAKSILANAQAYLIAGGPDNFANFFYFLSDTVLLTGIGFVAPIALDEVGVLEGYQAIAGSQNVVIFFYRAHLVSGNTHFIHQIAQGLKDQGLNPVPIYCYSLRAPSSVAPTEFAPIALAQKCFPVAVVVTMLAAGSMDETQRSWDASATSVLGVPTFQAIISSRSRNEFEDSDVGLAPLDASWQVAMPEFDGRIITVPVSFKEEVETGLEVANAVYAYRCDLERVQRLAELVARHIRLRSVPNDQKRIAVVLSAYPTKRSRLGNAVGLDTPESVIRLLDNLRSHGYLVSGYPDSGIDLMAQLSATYEYEEFRLSLKQFGANSAQWPVERYLQRFASLSPSVKSDIVGAWGEAPGEWYLKDDNFFFPGIWFENVFVTIQPPRGFGENPIAIYHSPKLAPTHHYLAFYWWLEEEVGADAIVHLGKHGTLEWLPGKATGQSRDSYPDIALGSMPLVYPFVVNDPGEGTQAKRRSHAVIVDHMIPPLTRADSYDELAEMETLLDAHARYSVLDPSKLPGIRAQVWELMHKAEIQRDLALEGSEFDFDESEFDEVLLELDGYLCEIKDATIRGGLHILGEQLRGEALIDLIFALTRLPGHNYPSLHVLVASLLELDPTQRRDSDEIANVAKELIGALVTKSVAPGDLSPVARQLGSIESVMRACENISLELLWKLLATDNELKSIAIALSGGFVEPGPSGSPSRGSSEVLPTGRNFYSIDPASLPTTASFETGRLLGEGVLERYLAQSGAYPDSIAIVVWGTAAMRTGGDDISEALWLIGARPLWDTQTSKVVGFEVVSDAELGRPRVDVTLRVSGFFRDAFPGVIRLFDEAASQVAKQFPESPLGKAAEQRRIFGPSPGGYGSGILPLLEAGNWRDDADLAEVYLAWSGYSYGSGGFGVAASESLVKRLSAASIAIKNQDNREHDIFDSDDYLQDHGGMLAAIRAITGKDALAYFGDSSNPSAPKTRTLAEEAARVVRSRVINPKWISAMKNHGYKGAFELSSTVDYLYGYDATANVVEDWMYSKVTDAYLRDSDTRKFLADANPEAAFAIANRLMEAISRGLWSDPSDQDRELLEGEILSEEARRESL